MTDRPAEKVFPNPFYVILVLASLAFVITIFGYLISPTIQQHNAGRPAGGASIQLAKWVDRNGPALLACELLVMIVSAFLAMATDRWFPSRRAKRKLTSGRRLQETGRDSPP
jgi:hypothetical protein